MTASADELRADARPRRGADTGAGLRSVVLTPRSGFQAAFKRAARRERAGRRPPEGLAPYVLACLGGVALMALWLKLSSLLGIREVAAEDFRWDLFVAALVAGSLIAFAAQWLWGGVAGLAGARSRPLELRLVWGTAAFPSVVALLVLLPLDVLIVGPEAYTSEQIGDPVATAWAAISIALTLAATAWSIWIFVRGVQAATSKRARAIGVSLLAPVCVGIVGLLSWLAVSALAGGA